MGRPGTPSLLREINDRAALELLLAEGPLTRSQVGEGTGLSKVTASQTLTRLEERGLVAVTGQQAGGRGPSAAVYAIVPSTASATRSSWSATRSPPPAAPPGSRPGSCARW